MKKVLVFLYGTAVYVYFLAVFLYAVGFVGNFIVPKSIDSGETGPIGMAILVNALVLGLFAVQHTVMARPAFKKAITKIIPKAAERSTFVLLTNLILTLIFWQWRPIDSIVWNVPNPIGAALLQVGFWGGWGMVLVSTFLIDHFELFGLSQIWHYLRGKQQPPPRFQEKSLYRIIRHPIMLGFIIAFWCTPTMTIGHLLFAGLTTGYILVGIAFEERDLVRYLGPVYTRYAARVPMLIPFLRGRQSGGTPSRELGEEPTIQ